MEWECSSCTTRNIDLLSLCEVCGSPNTDAPDREGKSTTLDQFAEQQGEIRAEIERTPLIADIQDLTILDAEYADNPAFLAKLKDLQKSYSRFRRVRGDGNCFYRAYLFSIVEQLGLSGDAANGEFTRFVDTFNACLDKLEQHGIERWTVEDFHAAVLDALQWVRDERPNASAVQERFADAGVSDSAVMFLRFLTSMHLQSRADEYEPYLLGKTMQQFIRSEVEPMVAECDFVQCMALARELGMRVRIEYLDAAPGQASTHILPPDDDASSGHDSPAPAKVVLLYRPGHYDILLADH